MCSVTLRQLLEQPLGDLSGCLEGWARWWYLEADGDVVVHAPAPDLLKGDGAPFYQGMHLGLLLQQVQLNAVPDGLPCAQLST